MPILSLSKVRHQSGAALMVVLLILLIMSLLSTSLVSNTVVGSRLAANKQYLMQLDMTARSAQARVMAQLSTKIGKINDPANVSGYASLVSGDDISATLSSIACIEQVEAVTGQWHSYWDSELTVNHSGSGAQVTATAGFRYTSDTEFDEQSDRCIPSTAASISVSGVKMVYLYFHHID